VRVFVTIGVEVLPAHTTAHQVVDRARELDTKRPRHPAKRTPGKAQIEANGVF
jgi:hypothetical protein